MSRRMANLLASIITAVIVSVSVHLYLDRNPPGGAPAPDTEEPPTVRMAFAGIAPRQELRLQVQKGYVEVDELRVWQSIRSQQGNDAGQLAPDAPAALVGSELAGLDIASLTRGLRSPDGEREATFRVRFEVKDADANTLLLSWKMLDAQVVEHEQSPAWSKAVTGARKLRGETRIDRTGAPITARMDGLRVSDPVGQELQTLLRRWLAEPAPIFPVEPVGHGAVWEITRELTDGGVRSRQTQRVEATELRAQTGRIKLAEGVSGALLTADVHLGPAMAAFGPSVTSFSATGDATWEASTGAIMAPGDAGGTSSARLDLALGHATMGLRTTVETELFVTRIE